VSCNYLCFWIVDFLGLTAPEWFFLFIELPLRNKYLSHLNSAFKIFVCTQTHTWFKLEVNKLFSIGIRASYTCVLDLFLKCDL
jgi:hypothetical protein